MSMTALARRFSVVVAVVVVLIGVCIYALYAGFAAGKPPTSKHSKKLPTDKEETISVYTDAAGRPSSADVELYLKNNQEKASLNDKSTLTEVEVTNNKQKDNLPEVKGEYLNWNTYNKDVNYSAAISTKDVPVRMNVAYYLDGLAVSGDDLYGKSGNLKIVITYKNNVKSKVGDKDVTVPMTAISYFYADSSMSNIQVTYGKVLKAKDKQVVIGIATPGLSDVLSAKLFGIATNKIVITGQIKRFGGITMSTNINASLLTVIDPIVFEKLNLDSKVIMLDSLVKKGLSMADSITATVVKYSGYIPWAVNLSQQVTDTVDGLSEFIVEFLKDIAKYNKELTKDLEVLSEVFEKVEEELGPLSDKEKVIIEYEILKKATDPDWTDAKKAEFEAKIAAMTEEEWIAFRDAKVLPEIIEMWGKLIPIKNGEDEQTIADLIPNISTAFALAVSSETPALEGEAAESEAEESQEADETQTDGEAYKEQANDPFTHDQDAEELYSQELQAEVNSREMQMKASDLEDTKTYLEKQKAELEAEAAELEAQEQTEKVSAKLTEVKKEIELLNGLIKDIDETIQAVGDAAQLLAGEDGLLANTAEINSAVDDMWSLIATNKLIVEHFAQREQEIKDAHPTDWETTEEWKQLKEIEKRYMKLDETTGKYVYMTPLEIAKQGISVTAIIAKLIDDNLSDETKSAITKYAKLASEYVNKINKFIIKLGGILNKVVAAIIKANGIIKDVYSNYIQKILGIYDTNLKGLASDLGTAQQAQLNSKPITGLTEGWTGSTTYYFEVPVGGGGNTILQALIP